MFQGSTWFTELITSKKYPDYKEYQRRVGKFLPKLTGTLPGDFSEGRQLQVPVEEEKELVKEKTKPKQKSGKNKK